MLLLQGQILPPQNATLCVIGRVRFERNCGKMYSCHLFPYGGLTLRSHYTGQLLHQLKKYNEIGLLFTHQADLATERERQMTTASANQTTGLTNDRVANWALEVEFRPFRALSRRQMTFPFCC